MLNNFLRYTSARNFQVQRYMIMFDALLRKTYVFFCKTPFSFGNSLIKSLSHSDVFLNRLIITIALVLCIVRLTSFQVSVFFSATKFVFFFVSVFLLVCRCMGFQT